MCIYEPSAGMQEEQKCGFVNSASLSMYDISFERYKFKLSVHISYKLSAAELSV